ncbi:MAG: imidazole glycerol phosphate synthase subunit HisF [Epulopiscium sp.]|nr:imidazole glycerol phosphate synthase subunit HisF [Candidatus Epulonipiscium sp.]
MQNKRIIPCLDLKDGRVVKGVNFVNLVDAGDPVEIAKAYEKEGADELVILDITASSDGRATTLELIGKISSGLTMPLTVGGGISTLEDIENVLDQGANKISIGSAAISDPDFVSRASKEFGKEKIVIGIDGKYNDSKDIFEVFIHGGRTNTGLDAVKWAREMEERGAGEILLTSMDCDGVKNGYDLKLTKAVASSVNIPVIASGGAGKKEHFLEALTKGGADAALAASLFHFKELKIKELKRYLLENNVKVRMKEVK